MNQIQNQVVEVFNLPKKYGMEHEDSSLLKNTVQLLVDALGIISERGLEGLLINKRSPDATGMEELK